MSEPVPGGASVRESNDVVELILADHREFERLFRRLRDREEDRPTRLRELADLLVAHAEAEEREVYPSLRHRAPEEDEEIAHSAEEHAEGHQELLALLEVENPQSDAFEAQLEELVETVTHHLDEEERDVLNAARENVPDDVRADLGERFLRVRREWLDASPGSREEVRQLVERVRERGDLE
ncbi:hemerythrin domain-containing protein [Egibacter rhizosphaerae]|uniref:Hemerythrin domain-containing protein n=1 Tax=Egibacter rhizosphaerae TaxID=1670831 RepID=A0A411YAR7_9ACTN|nr:hemerythrin domain-containing protein [Egibacter rhizosphaerae]QBI18272.1 hemerythrin domain-containing protein [Egibacter rhizosphaerae]